MKFVVLDVTPSWMRKLGRQEHYVLTPRGCVLVRYVGHPKLIPPEEMARRILARRQK